MAGRSFEGGLDGNAFANYIIAPLLGGLLSPLLFALEKFGLDQLSEDSKSNEVAAGDYEKGNRNHDQDINNASNDAALVEDLSNTKDLTPMASSFTVRQKDEKI
jgi:hypothetical protein